MPTSELAAAHAEITMNLPGAIHQAPARARQEDPEERNPKGSRGVCRDKKVDCALALVVHHGGEWRGICAITAYNHIARSGLAKVESDLYQPGQIIVSRSAISKVLPILARTDSNYALELQTEVGGGTKAHFSHELLYCKYATFQ